MSQKTVEIPGIGAVILIKRRGSKNLRLSITPDGRVKVGMPLWVPYATAIRFAAGKIDWIKQNLDSHRPVLLQDGHRIGKSHRLKFTKEPGTKRTYSRLGINTIAVSSHLDFSDLIVQSSATKACERALKKEAELLLKQRTRQIALRHGLVYKDLRIKRLTSRWGSCSQDGVITINYFLVQLPWRLIDYVIVHELVHTMYLNHSQSFWAAVDAIVPNSKHLRKEIKTYRPILLPN